MQFDVYPAAGQVHAEVTAIPVLERELNWQYEPLERKIMIIPSRDSLPISPTFRCRNNAALSLHFDLKNYFKTKSSILVEFFFIKKQQQQTNNINVIKRKEFRFPSYCFLESEKK